MNLHTPGSGPPSAYVLKVGAVDDAICLFQYEVPSWLNPSRQKREEKLASVYDSQSAIMEITAIIAICKTALDSGNKIYAAIRARSLSDKEIELLVHASRDGDFYVLRTDMHGPWVRAGITDFFVQRDRAHQACYLEAFRSLCQRGFVHHEDGHLFRLTGAGFAKARDLATDGFADRQDMTIPG